ncbi:hypothetical protein B0H12DRAFT_1237544 [Mycena haematopus]|nr:hypothetical protein B0H12DRAFT_1242770 [Mycena haematopus]KAJ7239579.1 hypothetical protein B0H12DRAFT_1237544 [Mycena haematopus]
MTTFTTAAHTAANTAANIRNEAMAVLATVDELVIRANRLSTLAVNIQQRIPALLQRLTEEEASDDTWVRATPRTPTQVAADLANLADGTRALWVVYVGREPGIYTTVESADFQIKGCPGQQYRRKTSKQEAVQFYSDKWRAGEVEKWVQMISDN